MSKILTENVLDLPGAGIDLMPFKTVEIESFAVLPEDQRAYIEKAAILGLLKKNKTPSPNYVCLSFLVEWKHNYYYRETLIEAIEVVRAIRRENNYTHHFKDI